MIVEAIAVGLLAGVVSGMFGVGGGVVFVPALVLLFDFGQVDAEATSLLAMIPVALVGAARQRRYGNIEVGVGVTIGLLAVAGAVGGVVLANVVPVRALEVGFAVLMVAIAAQLVRDALREQPDG